ncbi:thiamine pyrophosphate-binding protein [Labrys neptuniae]
MSKLSNQMKLSDYVARFLAERGIRHAFIVSGGASIHLLHSLAGRTDIEPICPHHEQAGAMAAEAYARVTGGLGCAIGTSGPGATNLITGIAGAWFDSVPTIFITGQVATYRMKGDTGVRQMGFQETEILPMVDPITKYAASIRDPLDIAYALEKAVYLATSGRPGPVILDIPDDLQRQIIDLDALRHFDIAELAADTVEEPSSEDIDTLLQLLREAERPVFVLGWGIRLAGAIKEALQAVRGFGVPVLPSWGAKDIVPENEPLLVGTFGTHGVRAGNFAMQNADLVIAIGARLSTHETGTPMTTWARGAKIFVVDIDPTELKKFSSFGKPLDHAVHADARVFLQALNQHLATWVPRPWADWRDRIRGWQDRYPVPRDEVRPAGTINPYAFVAALSEALSADEHIFIDTGCSVAWMMQGFPVRGAQRLYHDFNNTAMGWALPASIGGTLALNKKPVSCVTGDGSFMMNLQELATIQRHRLPIKIFVMNNAGYSMVQQTQEQWLGGDYVGTSYEGGLAFPNFIVLAEAFSIPWLVIEQNSDVENILNSAMAVEGPVLIDVRVPRTERVTPQAKFGYPIEDAEPLLPRDEFLSNMIVAPLSKSREPIE